ncbi:MAG: hypothetical protein GY832_33545 [Chloroflexi bacterium]|nr:hypothetical protein [Chloroflexota bacterium]
MTDIVVNPMYLDVSISSNGVFVQPVERGHVAFDYVFEGEGEFGVVD